MITLYLDPELIAECKKLAKKQNITLNEFIVNALTEFLNQQKAKNVRPF
jgi:predicted HicB family RNase H-like nuclease